ncbi:MAG: peptidylprolyl isomerase [Flavobacteriaceae bacterium]|nr:peptidylprolyl isomerase [Flavobacteriaceae bacterium]
MKYLSFYTLILFSIFTACEDNKKTSVEKTSDPSSDIIVVDSLIKDEVPEKVQENEGIKDTTYPLLTNENVVDFLTEYGKENPETRVRISTTHGDIDIELYRDTPLHRANFIYLVKQNYFYGTFLHRVVPNFIIQAGNSDNRTTTRKRAQIGKDYLLPAELNNNRIHQYGTISGAKEYRENPDKRTAPFEFFIFLGPKSATGHLNGKYTIFGRVTGGMEVVKKIANMPSDDGDWPLENIYIEAKILP